MKYRVIAGDNDVEIRDYYVEILQEKGIEVFTAETGKELLRKYKETFADLVIMDTLDSVTNRTLKYGEVINILRQMNPDVKILFISGLLLTRKNLRNVTK